jgi:hypothetical protein
MFMEVFIWDQNTLVLSFVLSLVSFVFYKFLNTKYAKGITKDTKDLRI